MATQNGLNGLTGKFRMVVLFTQVTKPDMLQVFAHVLHKCFSTFYITEMSGMREYALFKKSRIWAVFHHFNIVVSLDDEIICFADVFFHFIGYITSISNHTECGSFRFQHIPHIIATVMWNAKGSNLEVAYGKRSALFYIIYIV